jgi:perosamine synthetase
MAPLTKFREQNSDSIISHSRPTITGFDKSAVEATLNSRMIALGSETAKFEKAIADYLGLKGGISTSSGTSAIYLALQALGVSRGDEVILPTYVCQSVLSAVKWTGATPSFCDTNIFWNMDYSTVKMKVNSKTKAIIAPHIGGIPIDIKPIVTLGIPVIEDLAQSFGAEYKEQKAGTLGRVTICSFQAKKCITSGEGGMVLSNDEQILRKVKTMQDLTPISDIQSALGLSQLGQYPLFLKRRKEIAEYYFQVFDKFPGVSMPLDLRQNSIFFRFPLRIKLPFEELKAECEEKGIAVRQFIDFLLHRNSGYSDEDFPNATRCFKETLSIPIYPSLTNAQIKYIAKVMEKILERYFPLKPLAV